MCNERPINPMRFQDRKAGGYTCVATRKGWQIPRPASNPMGLHNLSLRPFATFFTENISGAVEGAGSERVVGRSARANGVSSRRGRWTPRAVSVPQSEMSSLIINCFFFILCPCFI